MKKWIKEEDVMGVLGIVPPELLVDHIADLDGVWMEDEDVGDVVLERLKAAADKLGYDIVPKKKGGELLPCPRCGCEDVVLFSNCMDIIGERFYYYQCPVCHLSNRRIGKTSERALMYWNSMVGEMRCK